jgi:cellulose synthase/poly-beta-1,6-N-acetylglucosamine synthase-like glycosyltransferase
MIRRLAFWGAAATIAFTYVGAPLLIVARAFVRPRPIAAADIEPTVSIVLAARNEAASIQARLINLAALDYPADRLEVILAADGCADDTVALAGAVVGPRTTILDLPPFGKAAALDAAIARATGDVVVFTDANTAFAPDAIRAIVRPLADPSVGGVAGNQVYLPAGSARDAVGERRYWDLDRVLKRAESAAGSTVSATGAIYALRRPLVPTVMAGVTDDFYTSTAVVDRGYRLVFAEDAIAYEPPAASSRDEYRRKVRIMSRGFRGVLARRALLDPRRTGFYAVQLGWHKVLRRLMAVPLIVLAVASLSLIRSGPLYTLAALGQLAGYAAAAVGTFAPRSVIGRSKVAALAAFFVMVNAASLDAFIGVLRGRRIERWDPQRVIAESSKAAPPSSAPEERDPDPAPGTPR